MSDSSIHHLIGIDAGGSKTIARLVDLNTKQSIELKGGSGSLTNNTQQACATICSLVQNLLDAHSLTPANTAVVCGAAGAENDRNAAELSRVLEPLGLGQLIIKTDAYISLLGATGGSPGIVVALGTGSVALRLDPVGTIHQYGGWGFRVGDQGSGAHLGRSLVIEVLKAFDRGNTSTPLITKVLDVIGHDRQSILNWVKSASAKDFASLCPILLGEKTSDGLAQQLVNQTVNDIIELIELARGDTELPVYLMGGLGQYMLEFLRDTGHDTIQLATGDAVDGALLVGRQALSDSD